jgi:hypothetical protein
MLERLRAAMDRQEAAMIRAISTMAAPESMGIGMIPVLSGPGVCARSVQITDVGDGRPPQIIARTAGDCGPARGEAAPAGLPEAPAAKPAPEIVQARAAEPYRGLVHQVGDRPARDWQVANRQSGDWRP